MGMADAARAQTAARPPRTPALLPHGRQISVFFRRGFKKEWVKISPKHTGVPPPFPFGSLLQIIENFCEFIYISSNKDPVFGYTIDFFV